MKQSIIINQNPSYKDIKHLIEFIDRCRYKPIIKTDNSTNTIEIIEDDKEDKFNHDDEIQLTDYLKIKNKSCMIYKHITYPVVNNMIEFLKYYKSPLYQFILDKNITHVDYKFNYELRTRYNEAQYYKNFLNSIDLLLSGRDIINIFIIIALCSKFYVNNEKAINISKRYLDDIVKVNDIEINFSELVSSINNIEKITSIKFDSVLRVFGIIINDDFNRYYESDIFEIKLIESFNRINLLKG